MAFETREAASSYDDLYGKSGIFAIFTKRTHKTQDNLEKRPELATLIIMIEREM